MNKVRSFEHLRIYSAACELQQRSFSATKSFPAEEKYSLTDQVRRSSRSIGANVAEACAKRRYEAHFTSKRTDVDGEVGETRHWINTAAACDYLAQDEKADLLAQLDGIASMLGAMMRKSEAFTPKFGRSDDK